MKLMPLFVLVAAPAYAAPLQDAEAEYAAALHEVETKELRLADWQAEVAKREAEVGRLEEAWMKLELLNMESETTVLPHIEGSLLGLREELAGLAVRRDVMEAHLVELLEKIEREVSSDALVRELGQAIERQTKRYDSLISQGMATPDVRLQTLELAIQLEQRRDVVRQREGGHLVLKLREGILDADIELAVLKGRRVALEAERDQARASSLESKRMAQGRKQALYALEEARSSYASGIKNLDRTAALLDELRQKDAELKARLDK